MTFTEYANSPISKKIVLVEIDLPAGPANFDIPLVYEPGIYFIAVTPGVVTITGSDSQIGYYTNQNVTAYYDISNIYVDVVNELIKVNSLEELRQQPGGFFYDKSETLTNCPGVFIRFENSEEPLDKIIEMKSTWGFCDKIDGNKEIGAYFNGSYYEPLVKSVPNIDQSKDPQFYGVIRINTGNVVFNNESAYFDNFKQLGLYGQEIAVKQGYEGLDYDDFEYATVGTIDGYSFTHKDFTIKIADKRKRLTAKLPKNLLTLTEFPYLNSSNVNKPKPIGFGNVKNAPLICLNETQTPTPTYYTYLLSDTEFGDIYSLSAVYCDGTLVSAADYFYVASTGILSVKSATVGSNKTEVTATFCPLAIYNSFEIIKWLILKYDNTAYIDANYDIAACGIVQADAQRSSEYITEQTDLLKVIERLCDDSSIVFFPLDDGRYSARLYDPDRSANITIENDEWISDPSVNAPEDTFLSEVTIRYDKDWKNDKYSHYVNTSYKTDAVTRYRREQPKEISTTLELEAGAIAKSEAIMSYSSNIQEIVKRKIKMQHPSLTIMDFVKCLPTARQNAGTINQIWEVLGRNRDLNSFETELTLRFVKTFVPVEPTAYQTGIAWGQFAWGHKGYEVAYE